MVVPLQRLTLSQMITRTASRFPERTAIETPEKKVSYAELARQTELLAAGLLRRGVRPGDHVAVWAELSLEMLLMFYAVQRIGAVAFPMNPELPAEAALCQLSRADIRCAAVGTRQLPTARQAAAQMAVPCELLLLSGTDCGEHMTIGHLIRLGGDSPAEELSRVQAGVQPEDAAVMLLTSGTTGAAKMVLTSHFSRINSGIQQAHDMGASESDKFLVALPAFHCFCLSANLYAALAVGAALYLPASRHTSDLVRALRAGRCTILHAVPTQFRALIDNPGLRPGDTDSLRTGIIGGGGYSPQLFRRIEQTLGITLLSSLGMTEATAGVTVCNMEDDLLVRSTTVGHFMSHLRGKIVDIHTGAELPVGASGEICVQGYSVMLGYYRASELTSQCIDAQGWLRTGDFGCLDSDGNLHLKGRIKELIIRGGENISPAEVENVILRVPGVFACKVVGIPDEHFGEEVCAVVVREEGCQVTADDIRKYTGSRLEKYKVPKEVVFTRSLPQNSVGKVDMRAVKQFALHTLCRKPREQFV